MKRVLEFRKVPKDRKKVHLYWAWEFDWLFRHVECGECGNQWWEAVRPAKWASGQECCG